MKSPFSWRFFSNYLCTMLLLVGGYSICFELSNWYKGMLGNTLIVFGHALHAQTLFQWLIGLYAVVLIPYYLRYPWVHAKAFVFLRGVWMGLARSSDPDKQRRKGGKPLPARLRGIVKPKMSKITTQATLSILLKFFYAPLMINWCLGHIGDMSNNVWTTIHNYEDGMTGRILFDNGLFWACFQLILFADTFFFTLGYIIEIPLLGNRIRSVEPTLLGWFVCLACYPPFNNFTSFFFEWQSNDFPRFENDTIHLAMNCGILLLMGFYSWASVALNFKASNLTNRGIVAHGPYRWVRHPAYVAKNTAWWIGAMPTFYAVFTNNGLKAGLYSLAAIVAWTFIYYMRAITEERHLLRANNGYAEYMKKVKWRFIPGLI